MRAAGDAIELAPMTFSFPPVRAGGAPVFNFRSEGPNWAAMPGVTRDTRPDAIMAWVTSADRFIGLVGINHRRRVPTAQPPVTCASDWELTVVRCGAFAPELR